MDFDAAEHERRERDGGLRKTFAQKVEPGTGNLYLMPSGALVSAEDALYNPTVVAATPQEAFGDDWMKQNA